MDIPFAAIKIGQNLYTRQHLKTLFLAHGTERWSFLNPQDKNQIIKVSLKQSAKQSKREIAYFSFLQKKNIPFTHIPTYYGKLVGKNYIALKQEFVRNYDGSRPKLFTAFFEQNPSQAMALLKDFARYLYQYNILPCDLTAPNMLVISTAPNQFKLMLIDGVGCTDLIPLAQYIKFLGRQKIRRKIIRFLTEPFFQKVFKTHQERSQWVEEIFRQQPGMRRA